MHLITRVYTVFQDGDFTSLSGELGVVIIFYLNSQVHVTQHKLTSNLISMHAHTKHTCCICTSTHNVYMYMSLDASVGMAASLYDHTY